MNVSGAISHGVHGLQVGRERVTHYDRIGSGLGALLQNRVGFSMP